MIRTTLIFAAATLLAGNLVAGKTKVINVPADVESLSAAVASIKSLASDVDTVSIRIAEGSYQEDSPILIRGLAGKTLRILGSSDSPRKVRINFGDKGGIRVIQNSTLTLIDGLVLLGSGKGAGLLSTDSGYLQAGKNVTVRGFTTGASASKGATLVFKGLSAGNAGAGISAIDGGSVVANGAKSNNNKIGILATQNGNLSGVVVSARGNEKSGIVANRVGTMVLTRAVSINNGTTGVAASFNAQIALNKAVDISGNGTRDIFPESNAASKNGGYVFVNN